VAAASTALLGSLVGTGHAVTNATVSVVNGNDVVYIGSDRIDDVVVTSNSTLEVFIQDPGTTAGPGCTETASQGIKCVGTSRFDYIKLDLGEGNDTAKVQTSIRTDVLGGAGEFDRYLGATTATGTNVRFDGGPGANDRADYSLSSSGALVDLDNSPDDGRLGKDVDNITGTVENLTGSDHDDSLRGNFAKNSISGLKGADALRGGGGDDEIRASEFNPGGSTADKADLSCGTGNDVITLDQDDPAPAACETIRRAAT
jgi:hypothetical protein